MTNYLWQRAAILAVAILVGWVTGHFLWGMGVALILFFSLTIGRGLVAPWIERKENRRDWERSRRF